MRHNVGSYGLCILKHFLSISFLIYASIVFYYQTGFQPSNMYEQQLLVQGGKLYGRDPLFSVITKAAMLPDITKGHDIQKNESVVQLGQVKTSTLLSSVSF